LSQTNLRCSHKTTLGTRYLLPSRPYAAPMKSSSTGETANQIVLAMTSTSAPAAGLVRGRHVIQGIDRDGEPLIIADGAVQFRDGVIESVGDFAELFSRHPDLPVLGDRDAVIAPGFVNGHHHVGLTPLQLGSRDHPLELWFASRLGARAVDPYLDALHSAFEMIASGVTTVQHLHGRIFGPLDALLDGARETTRAYRDVGMRVSYSYGIRDQNRLVYEDDDIFCSRLPKPLGERLRAILRAQVVPVSDALALFSMLDAENPRGGRVRVQLAPQNLHWCSDRALTDVASAARASGAPMHMHLLETAYQREYARRRTGGSPIRFLHGLGMLGPDMTLGHGVWCTEEDLEILGESGTCVCCNASSNLRLRSGIAPHAGLKQHRITLGMGIDEAGINDDRDMLLEMRMLLRLSRTPGMDDAPFTPAEVFRIATEGGGATTPFKGAIGALRPGYAMDCVVFDWSAIAGPFLDARTSLMDALVQRAKPAHVRCVIVEGCEIYRDGRFLLVDRDEIEGRLQERMRTKPTADELERAQLSEEVFKHVRDFYSIYVDTGAMTPHSIFNAR
jgi:5-methylthioadenosine/S-adenosylhomocysteine deaminase